MAYISITVSDTAHWHALIGKAEFFARQLLPQGIEDYLVRLFMRFERERETSPLKLNDANGTKINKKLQRLGDQCLLLCGFYPEVSEEYGVALEEFISMGTEAYQKLASEKVGEEALIFEYLANYFKQVSGLLQYIQTFSGQQVDKQICCPENQYEELSTHFSLTEQPLFSNPISHRILN